MFSARRPITPLNMMRPITPLSLGATNEVNSPIRMLPTSDEWLDIDQLNPTLPVECLKDIDSIGDLDHLQDMDLEVITDGVTINDIDVMVFLQQQEQQQKNGVYSFFRGWQINKINNLNRIDNGLHSKQKLSRSFIKNGY